MKTTLLVIGGLIMVVVLWGVMVIFSAVLIWAPLYFVWNYGIIHLYPHAITWSQAFGLACALSLANSVLSKSSSKE